MKRCPTCERLLDVGEFALDRSKASGRKSWCKSCDAAKARRYYQRNRAAVILRASAYNSPRRKAA
jgi:predicted RNA-binding Zn ribbon-like protein